MTNPRGTAMEYWVDNPTLTAAQVATWMEGQGVEVRPGTLRQWKRRHGEFPAAAPRPEPLADPLADPVAAAPADPLAAAATWEDARSLVPWDDNPRDNEHAVPHIAASIRRFGYGRAWVAWRPTDRRMLVVGHTAHLAVLYNLQHFPDVCPPDAPAPDVIPVRWRSDWTEAEARAYAIADNKLGELSGWVDEALAAQLKDLQANEDIEAELLGFAEEELDRLMGELTGDGDGTGDGSTGVTLAQRFGAPPFSVWDGRQGYWQDRKRSWLALGIKSEEGRDGLTPTANASEGKYDYMTGRGNAAGAGSIFDPVLMELGCRWFAPVGGSVFDPFAGGSVRGVVAACLGHEYTGIDLRSEQVEANRAQWVDLQPALQPAAVADEDQAAALPPGGIEALMRGFKPVAAEHADAMAPYLAGFARTRKWPRYYLATAWLASLGRSMLWGVVGGCLVVVKRSNIMKDKVLYLILPPMHPGGDVAAELAVLHAFSAAGVSCKLSDEDVGLYGLGADEYTPDKGNEEFIYRAGDYAEMVGGRWSKWRRDRREFGEHIADGWALHDDNGTRCQVLDGMIRCSVGRATGDKHARSIKAALRQSHRDWSSMPTRLAALVHPDGDVRLALASQQVAPNWAVLMVGTYGETGLSNVGRVGHLIDVDYYAATIGPDALLSLGAAVRSGDGLEKHKTMLRPCHQLPINNLTVTTKFTEEDWQAVHPDKLAASPALELDVERPIPTWLAGDSRAMGDLLPDGAEYDLIFTCPPYFDLEVYSDDPNDISGMGFDAFVEAYTGILSGAVQRLRPNRFAVIVIGDVRDGDGFYRNLIGVTVDALEAGGARLYNSGIYITPAGTLPIRSAKAFRASRKLANAHQSVVIAYKGDPKDIRSEVGEVPEWAAPDVDVDAEGAT